MCVIKEKNAADKGPRGIDNPVSYRNIPTGDKGLVKFIAQAVEGAEEYRK